MIVRSKTICADKPNLNGHIYSKEVLKIAIEKSKEKVKPGFYSQGELNRNYSLGNTTGPLLENISHEVESISLNEKTGFVEGKIKILETPSGKKLQTLIDSGCKIFGDLTAVGILKDNIVTECEFRTFDIVADFNHDSN